MHEIYNRLIKVMLFAETAITPAPCDYTHDTIANEL